MIFWIMYVTLCKNPLVHRVHFLGESRVSMRYMANSQLLTVASRLRSRGTARCLHARLGAFTSFAVAEA